MEPYRYYSTDRLGASAGIPAAITTAYQQSPNGRSPSPRLIPPNTEIGWLCKWQLTGWICHTHDMIIPPAFSRANSSDHGFLLMRIAPGFISYKHKIYFLINNKLQQPGTLYLTPWLFRPD
ncbi:MAG: hypothetical protein V5A59_10625 [Bacteroidales bacterium]